MTVSVISVALAAAFLAAAQCHASPQFGREVQRHIGSLQNYWQQFLLKPLQLAAATPPSTTPWTTPWTTTTAASTTASVYTEEGGQESEENFTEQLHSSPHVLLTELIASRSGGFSCGVRTSAYLPHLPLLGGPTSTTPVAPEDQHPRVPRRRGRIVWDEDATMGTAPAPEGTFPWMASLFVLYRSGEALFMCGAAILTPNVLLTAAHCFTSNARPETWFARVGDNFIVNGDRSEQTFRVKRIVQHHMFDPLREDGQGDGRHDIAIVVLQPHRDGSLVRFNGDVRPICVPPPDFPLHKLYYEYHCEIAGWGMTEYNNTNSYPDSLRAATITVGDISNNYCDYLYQRDVAVTGKFCAGGSVDACQEDSGGPLVCRLEGGNYHIIGIVSSGKGCGVYPGLYTDVSRYVDWLSYWVQKESV